MGKINDYALINKSSIGNQDRFLIETSEGTKSVSAKSIISIDSSAVDTMQIANGAVNEYKIVDGAVTTYKIASHQIKDYHLDTGAVKTDAIYKWSVTENKIYPGAVTSEKIGANQIKYYHLYTDSVRTDAIRNQNVTKEKLSSSLQNEIDNKLESSYIQVSQGVLSVRDTFVESLSPCIADTSNAVVYTMLKVGDYTRYDFNIPFIAGTIGSRGYYDFRTLPSSSNGSTIIASRAIRTSRVISGDNAFDVLNGQAVGVTLYGNWLRLYIADKTFTANETITGSIVIYKSSATATLNSISPTNDIQIIQGDTVLLSFQRLDTNGNVIFGNADRLYFTVKKSRCVSEAMILKTKKDMTIDENGVYHFSIDPEDTDELSFGEYYYDLEVIYENIKTTIAFGKFTILPEVTWAQNESEE